MKFTKEQAHQVLYLYDANLDNVQLAPTRVDTMLHALNEVFADLPAPTTAGDALTPEDRAYVEAIRARGVYSLVVRDLLQIIHQLAPASASALAPKTPGQVAYEASCCWAEENPADRARWEAIAQAVLAAAGARP
jgi:hypothetical protein